jgi:hypothetical protein
MAKGKSKSKSKKSSRTYVSEESEEDDAKNSIFHRLFLQAANGGSISKSDDGESDGSRTLVSETESASSSDDQTEGADSAGQENSEEDRELQKFDRELRAKHRGACKNMTVSTNLKISPSATQVQLAGSHVVSQNILSFSVSEWQICKSYQGV